MALSAEDFDYVSDFARTGAAIVLEKGKEYLVETRLGPLAEREGYASLRELIGALRTTRVGPLGGKVMDALTTNETFFFRDFHPFESLRKTIIPKLIEQRANTRRLSIWSGACSTGQEAYSMAMMLREHFPQLASWRIDIVGTDLSSQVLTKAKAATYSQLEVNRGLPATYLIKYFTKQGDSWVLKDELRKMVDFRPMNLIQAWPVLSPFDVIFMRNVMIYFDVGTKRTILKKLRACLNPSGFLVLGSAETTMNLDPQWKPVTVDKATLYQPV
jgi:chemotaxis protein methyltransferase CheR